MKKQNAKYKLIDGKSKQSNRLAVLYNSSITCIYKSLYITLKVKAKTLLLTCILIFFYWLQLIGLFFTDDKYNNWGYDSLTKRINLVVDFIILVPAIQRLGFIPYLIFHIIFFIILILMILFFIYISTIDSNSGKQMLYLVKFNKYLIYISMTILIIPFISMFSSGFSCENRSGSFYIRNFDNEKCFSGLNVINMVIGSIGIIIYSIYLFIVSSLFYETKLDVNTGMAGTNSFCNLSLTIFGVINAILITLDHNTAVPTIQLVFNFLYSLVLIYFIFLHNPYYNHSFEKLTKIMLGLFYWTLIVYTISLILEGDFVRGPFIGWLIGLPSISLIVYFKQGARAELLVIPPNTIHDPTKLYYELLYLIKLWLRYYSDKQSAMLLDGYIEVHRNICKRNDCPITVKKNDDEEGIDDFNGMHDKMIIEDVQKFIDMLYFDIIKRFETNIKIRLNYLFFLTDKIKNNLVAVKELEVLEMLNPNFQEKFIIYKYKRMVEDIENEEDQKLLTVNMDHKICNETYNKYMIDLFMKKLEESVVSYIDFWSIIMHEKIDFDQLKMIGAKIDKIKVEIDKSWNKVVSLNTSSKSELMVVYGKYLTSIANDTEEGEELIAKAQKMIEIESSKKKDLNYFEITDDISKILIPLIIVSGQPKQIGIIVNINMSCCAMFGYTKKELIGKNIKKLVPDLVASQHDKYIENVIEKKKVNFFNMGRIVYAKHHNEYIVPVSIRGKMFEGAKIFFAATLRVLHSKDTIAILMVDEKGQILDISSGCYILLGISIISLQTSRDLDTYLPGLFSKVNSLSSNSRIEISDNNFSKDVRNAKGNKKLFVQIEKVQYIRLSQSTYIIKIYNELPNVDEKLLTHSKQAKTAKFRMKYNIKYRAAIAQNMESNNTNSDKDFQSNSFIDNANAEDNPNYNKNIDYGENIKTMQLDEGKIVEAKNNFTEEDDNMSNDLQKQNYLANSETDDLFEEANAQKDPLLANYGKSKHVKAYIKDMAMPNFVKIYLLFSHILILALLGLILLDFVLKGSQTKIIEDYVKVLDNTTDQETEVQNILSQLGLILASNIAPTLDIDNEAAKQFINFSVDKLERLNTDLSNLNPNISKNDVYNYLYEESIEVANLKDRSIMTKLNLRQSRKQIITKSFYLIQNSLSDINLENPILIFFFDGILNNIRILAKDTSDAIVDLIADRTKNFIIPIIIQSIFIAIVGLSLLFIFYFYSKLNEHTKNILSVFSKLSDRKISFCLLKCEDFLNYIQSDKEENNILTENDIRHLQKLDNDEGSKQNTKSKKKFDRISTINRSIFVLFGTAMLIFEGVYFLSVFMFRNHLNHSYGFIQELNVTKAIQSEYNFFQNAIMYAAIEGTDNVSILNTPFADYRNTVIKTFYELDSSLYEWKHYTSFHHSDEYNELINAFISDNLCDTINKKNDIEVEVFSKPFVTDCHKLKDNENTKSYVSNGLSVGISFYQQNLRNIAEAVDNYQAGSPDNDSRVYNPKCQLESSKKKLCALESDVFQDAQQFQIYYFQYLNHIWSKQILKAIENYSHNKIIRTQLFFAIGFLVFGSILYAIYFAKFIVAVRNNVRRLEHMLLMIPSDHSAHPSYLKGVLFGKND